MVETPKITTGFLQHNRLYLTSIEIDEFLRLQKVKIDIPAGTNVFAVAGQNGAGKTSVLKFLESLVNPQVVKSPGHNGAPEPKGRITLSDRDGKPVFYWDRWWKEGKAGVALRHVDTYKVVEGSTAVIKELIYSQFGDPLRFMNAQPIDQRKWLEKIAGIDMSDIEAKIKQADEEAKKLEERQAALKARSDAMPWYDDVPESEVDFAQVSADLQEAIRANGQNQIIREQLVNAKHREADAAAEHRRASEHIEKLRRDLENATIALENAKEKVATAHEAVEAKVAQIAELKDIDTAPYEEQIQGIQGINAKVRENQLKIAAVEEWEASESQVKEHVATVNGLKAERKRILANAKFPVPGLDFEAGGVLLNGKPFIQASNAEKIRVALAIVMSDSPLRVAYIDEAAALDNKSMRILAQEAKKLDVLVFTFFAANRGEGDGYDRPADLYLLDGEVDESGKFDPEFYLKNADQIPSMEEAS